MYLNDSHETLGECEDHEFGKDNMGPRILVWVLESLVVLD